MNIIHNALHYPPLSLTRTLLRETSNLIESPRETWKQTAQTITCVASRVLVALVLILPDLIFSTTVFLLSPLKKFLPVPFIRAVDVGSVPNRQAQAVDATPTTRTNRQNRELNHFKQAVNKAFQLIGREKVLIYKDLIKNDGVPAEGEAEVEIFQWCAKALLIHALTDRSFYTHNEELQTQVSRLRPLTQAEKTVREAAFLKALNQNTDCRLAEPAQEFMNQINTESLSLVQNRYFQNLFGQLADQIDN